MKIFIITADILFSINDEYNRCFEIYLGNIENVDDSYAKEWGQMLLDEYCEKNCECHSSDARLIIREI
jgi:hypothetical protein